MHAVLSRCLDVKGGFSSQGLAMVLLGLSNLRYHPGEGKTSSTHPPTHLFHTAFLDQINQAAIHRAGYFDQQYLANFCLHPPTHPPTSSIQLSSMKSPGQPSTARALSINSTSQISGSPAQTSTTSLPLPSGLLAGPKSLGNGCLLTLPSSRSVSSHPSTHQFHPSTYPPTHPPQQASTLLYSLAVMDDTSSRGFMGPLIVVRPPTHPPTHPPPSHSSTLPKQRACRVLSRQGEKKEGRGGGGEGGGGGEEEEEEKEMDLEQESAFRQLHQTFLYLEYLRRESESEQEKDGMLCHLSTHPLTSIHPPTHPTHLLHHTEERKNIIPGVSHALLRDFGSLIGR